MENPYESSRLLDEYLLFHYGDVDDTLPTEAIAYPQAMREAWGFPHRTVKGFRNRDAHFGLDIGCAVGASSFVMARQCQRVIGIDYSHSFIHAANLLREGKTIDYRRVDEGMQAKHLSAQAPSDIDLDRVTFEQGDAHALREDIGTFDQVHAANVLCRLAEPVKLLQRLPQLVRAGGDLVIATPCTWLESFTPSANWPQGSTIDWLKDHLLASFALVKTWDEPFLIRETARKFQWSSSQLSLWTRRDGV
jgi:putative 4-mercaptohistidine N1-methyltranferase